MRNAIIVDITDTAITIEKPVRSTVLFPGILLLWPNNGVGIKWDLFRHRLLTVAGLVVLAFAVYLPALRLPFIEDDYPLIAQANAYGSGIGWASGMRDAVNRPRLASLFLLHELHKVAGMNPAPFYLAGICLHACNTLLVFALGAWRIVGYRIAAWAAAFFALYEGHHEAVMWISANNELLLFLFGVASFACWLRFLNQGALRWIWYGLAVVAYCFALISKESAVIVLVLLALPAVWPEFSWTRVVLLLPFAAITALSVLSIAATRAYSGHFHDGSFSLSAPFVWTWFNSYWRLFWIWGLVAIVFVLLVSKSFPGPLRAGAAWAAISLLPYVFLLYNTRVPSRHTYLASAGLSLIVGVAFTLAAEKFRGRRMIVAIAAIVILLQSAGWIWTRKRSQLLRRAEPTEQLIATARRAAGPVYVRCFPRQPVIAEQAVRLMANRLPSDLVWTEQDAAARHAAAVYCFKE